MSGGTGSLGLLVGGPGVVADMRPTRTIVRDDDECSVDMLYMSEDSLQQAPIPPGLIQCNLEPKILHRQPLAEFYLSPPVKQPRFPNVRTTRLAVSLANHSRFATGAP